MTILELQRQCSVCWFVISASTDSAPILYGPFDNEAQAKEKRNSLDTTMWNMTVQTTY